MSFRSDELHRSHPLRPLITDWERVRSVRRLELRASAARRRQVSSRRSSASPPTPALVEPIYERSEGNAFLVEEILGGAAERRRPRRSCRRRCATSCWPAPSGSRRPRQGCCGSRPPRARPCPTGCSPPSRAARGRELDAALREAVEHHLLVVDEERQGYGFRHALTRDAVYSDTLPRERVAHPRRLRAGAVRRPGARRRECDRAAAARRCTGRRPTTSRARCRRASRRRGWRPPTRRPRRCAHLERALEMWPSVARCRGALRHRRRRGAALRRPRSAYAAGELDRSLALLRRGARRARARAPTGAARAAHRGREGAGAARPRAHRGGQREPRARRGAAAGRAADRGPRRRARLARREPDDGERSADAALGRRAGRGGGGRRGRARARGRRPGSLLGIALRRTPAIARRPGELRRQGSRAGRGRRARSLSGARLSQPVGRACMTRPLRGGGRGRAARVWSWRAAPGSSAARSASTWSGNLAETLFHLGRWDEAERLLTRTPQTRAPTRYLAGLLLQLRGLIGVLAGRYDAARRTSARHAGSTSNPAATSSSCRRSSDAPSSRARRGDVDAAREHVRIALDVADESMVRVIGGRSCGSACGSRPRRPSPTPSASRRLAARRRAARGDAGRRAPTARWPPREAARAPATGRRRRRGVPGSRGSLPARLRAAAPGAGRVRRAAIATAAAPALEEARGSPPAIGAAPLLEEARALARRARGCRSSRRRRQPEPGIDAFGLTEREREVLDLLADGSLEPPDRRGAVHQPQDGQRPRVEHHRQARRHQPRRGGRSGPPPGREPAPSARRPPRRLRTRRAAI